LLRCSLPHRNFLLREISHPCVSSPKIFRLQQENFIAQKTPGHKEFFFLLFTNVFFHVPGVSEATFLVKKELRNTGGINSPVRANWMGQNSVSRGTGRDNTLNSFQHLTYGLP